MSDAAPFDLGVGPPAELDMRQVVAIHEACHMAIAEAGGLKVATLEVGLTWRGHANGSGLTRLDLDAVTRPHPTIPGATLITEEQLHAYLLCCIAGARGVRMWFMRDFGTAGPIGGVNYADGSGTDEDDYRKVNRIMRISRQRADAECDRFLNMHWPRITVAARLLMVKAKIAASAAPQTVAAEVPQVA